jgi:hypothetical protein
MDMTVAISTVQLGFGARGQMPALKMMLLNEQPRLWASLSRRIVSAPVDARYLYPLWPRASSVSRLFCSDASICYKRTATPPDTRYHLPYRRLRAPRSLAVSTKRSIDERQPNPAAPASAHHSIRRPSPEPSKYSYGSLAGSFAASGSPSDRAKAEAASLDETLIWEF